MNMALHNAERRLGRRLAEVLDRGQMNAADVVLEWDANGEPDPHDEGAAAAESLQRQTVRALVHFVNARTVVRNAEYAEGDAIITFDADVDLAGKKALRFILPNGLIYVQHAAGRAVEELWEVAFGGRCLARTLLLRMKGRGARSVMGGVYLVDGETTLLYRWRDGAFTLATDDAMARLDFDTEGELTIRIGGVACLHADAERVQVVAATDVLPVTEPRLEFRDGGGVVRAVVTAGGTLWSAQFSDTDPQETGAMPVTSAGLRVHLFTIGRPTFYAPLLIDGLNP